MDVGLARENTKLRKINAALMRRVEQDFDTEGVFYHNFQHAASLEEQVRARTQALAEAMDQLRISNARLGTARAEAEKARTGLTDALEAIQEGFALFDGSDCLVLSNSRFCAHLPDVQGRMRHGMAYLDYVRTVAASRDLSHPPGSSPEDYVALRSATHGRSHVNFIVEVAGDRWLQVSEQRTPSNGTAVIQTDVTEMIRRERDERDKLLDAQARMVRATLDHIRQGVAIFDAGHRLVGWNRRLRELMMPPVQLMQTGTHFAAVLDYFRLARRFGSEEARDALLAWVGGPARRDPLSMELRRDDGTVLDLFAQATPDRGFVVSFTDVSAERGAIAALHRANETLESRVAERTLELEAARLAAERANASKSRFLASASHDLLQPLSAAKLFLSSLRGTDLRPDQRPLVGRIHSAFESVEGILGALLDISKLEMGMARTEIEAFPLAHVFTTLADEFAPSARAKKLELRLVPSRLWVESDRLYLRRILGNLVSNAIRYTARGRVVIGARRLPGALRIEVWDTGPGIPPDRTAEIFREFTRLEPEGSAGAGVGLGLAIVEQACALLRHPLAVRSRVGHGTVFSVEVPRARPVAADDAIALAEEPVGPLEDMIALIVENDREVRAGMVGLLESWGASPLDTGNLAGARALIADIGVAPDVVIADYHLDDGQNGLSAIEALRADWPDLPAVMVTADRAPELRRRAEAARILLLHKPVPVHQLRLVLHQIKLQQAPPEAPAPARPGDSAYWYGAFLDGR